MTDMAPERPRLTSRLWRDPLGWAVAQLRANPRPVIIAVLDLLFWTAVLGGAAAIVTQQGWAQDVGAWASGGSDAPASPATAIIGGALGLLSQAWRLLTAPLFGAAGLLGLDRLAAPPARHFADAALWLLVLASGPLRALAASAQLRQLQRLQDESAMEALLRRRLDAVYVQHPQLVARARDQRTIASDAAMLAPWCAQFLAFQTEDREADEIELDRNWLRRTIVLNVPLEFPDLPAHQDVAAKGWVSELVLTEMIRVSTDKRRAARKGPQRLRRTLRMLGVGAVLVLGVFGVEAIYAFFTG